MVVHRGIVQSFYADELAAGVVLTRDHQLLADVWWDAFKFDTTPARQLEADINDLRLKAGFYLAEGHRRLCVEHLMRIYKGMISSLRVEYWRWNEVDASDKRSPHPGHFSDLRELRRELDAVRATYSRIGSHAGRLATYLALR